MPKVFLSCFIFSLIFSVQANTQIITVESAISREALVAALITDRTATTSVITNERGQADIRVFAGSDSLSITYLGYQGIWVATRDLAAMGYKIHLQEAGILLGTVPVTATRWSQPQRQSAQPLAIVRPGEVRLQNPQTAADLLALSGQVYIQKSQLGGGSPMIRGFAANRVLISVDGVRMNTAIFRSGNLQNVIALDPLALDQTEIILGPGSLLYGSDALGGVMLFQTRNPSLVPTDDRFLRGQSYFRFASASQEKTFHLDFHYGRGKWAFLTSATRTDYDDLRMGRYGPDEYLRSTYAQRIDGKDTVLTNPDPIIQVGSGYSQFNLMQKIRFVPNKHWDLQYAFHYSTTSDVPRYDRLIRPRSNTLRSAEWAYGPQRWQLHHLLAKYSGTSKLYDQLHLSLAYQKSAESRMNRDLHAPTRFVREESVDALSLNIDFLKKLSASQTFQYGLEGVYNLVGSGGMDINVLTGESVSGSSRYPDGSTWSSWSAFGLYRIELSDKWTCEAGLRYNLVTLDATFDSTFYAFPFDVIHQRNGLLTGNIGVIWRPEESWQFSFQGSSGFRSPNVDDAGKVFDSTPGMVVVPNPDLKPEYAYSADVGIVKTIDDRFRFHMHIWYTLLDNAMVRRDYLFNGMDSLIYNGELSRVQALQNAAEARVWGVQGGIEAILYKGLRLKASSSWQYGEEVLDDGSTALLRHAAPWFGALSLQYETKAWKADLSWQVNAGVPAGDLPPEEQGKDYLYALNENGQPYVPAWSILNAKFLWQTTNYLSLSAGIENILDLRYRPYSSGITASGRNVIVGLRVAF